MTQMEDFIRGLLGDGKTEVHKVTPVGSEYEPRIMLCDAGGWASGTDSDVNCPDCLAIMAGTAEPISRHLVMA